MKRDTFIKNSILAGAAIAGGLYTDAISNAKTSEKPFRTKFSPEFDIFAKAGGKDPIDQIKWGYDQGFRAWENTWLKSKTVQEQEKISNTIQKLGMEFGQFVGTITFKDVTFAGSNKELRDRVLSDVKDSVEVAKRMNTKYIHNVLGLADPKLPKDFQMANAIELLKRIGDIYEPHGIISVMETMNSKVDHPGMFLHEIPQAYLLAKAVGSPSVKILFDFYHVQIEEGNVLSLLDHAWDEIAYLQIGDAPGRFEPTTGEINYVNVLRHVAEKGYTGFIGMEHRIKKPGIDGELAALKAYRDIDPM